MANEHGYLQKVTDPNDMQLCRLGTRDAKACADDQRLDMPESWRIESARCGRLSDYEHKRVIPPELCAWLSDYFNLRQMLRPGALRASARRWNRVIEAIGSRPDLYRADASASRSVAG